MRIEVLCPNPDCKAVLGFDVESPIGPNVGITCPKCKQKSYYKDFLPVKINRSFSRQTTSGQDGDATQYASGKTGASSGDKEKTQLGQMAHKTVVGVLQLVGYDDIYPLKQGHNIVGRQAFSSSATIQIPDPLNMRTMSRSHLVIDVVVKSTIVRYIVSLSPGGAKNATRVNGAELQPDSKLFLNDGDRITIGQQTLLFRIIDSEKTTIL